MLAVTIFMHKLPLLPLLSHLSRLRSPPDMATSTQS